MIKKWILNRKFVKDALLQAEIKAFPKAQTDIIETMADDLEQRASELADKKLGDLLSPIDFKQIVTLNKQQGILFIGGEQVDKGEIANLRSEAEFLLASSIWKLLQESPKDLAYKAMFVAGETLVDMQKGRSMLYTLQAQKNILDLLMQTKK